MNIFKLSIKNLFYRPLSSLLSLLLLALGVSMISLLILINSVVQDQMNNNLKGIGMRTSICLLLNHSPPALPLVFMYNICPSVFPYGHYSVCMSVCLLLYLTQCVFLPLSLCLSLFLHATDFIARRRRRVLLTQRVFGTRYH